MVWLIAILAGTAAAAAAWGGREWLAARYRTDVAWIESAWLRFNPSPPDPRQVALVYYLSMLAMLAVLLALLPNRLAALGLWLVMLVIPGILVEALWKRRRAQIDLQLPAAIASMANSIRAGLTLVQALQRLAEQAPDPIRTEFQIMANRYAFGADLESTIREAKERLSLQNFNLFASALLLNREMGGDVSETLDRISRALDKLHQMRQTVEAHTAEGRTNIKVLLVAPIVMLLMIAAVDGPGVALMFTTPQGYAILLVAGLLIAAGLYFAWRITRSDV